MKQIPLTQGQIALVDNADYDWMNQWKWCATKAGKTFYAVRAAWDFERGSRYTVFMHREIFGNPEAPIVDHRDLNGLHNWRDNLRAATFVQNLANRGPNANNKSGFRGVSFISRPVKKPWRVFIGTGDHREMLGCFHSAVEAARAYNKRALELFGVFARLNEVES